MKTGLNKRQKTTAIYFDEYIKVWFLSACTNMGQQTNTTRRFFRCSGIENAPSHE